MAILLKTPVLCPFEESNVPEVRFHVFDRLWWEGEGGQSWGTYVQTLQLHEGPTCITMATCMNRSNAVVSPLVVSLLYQSIRNLTIERFDTRCPQAILPLFTVNKREKHGYKIASYMESKLVINAIP